MLNILCLFDRTGNMGAPWRKAGHHVTLVDLQHPPGLSVSGRGLLVGADVLTWEPRGPYDAVFAFPPCTDLAVSGARHFEAKGPERREAAMRLVYRARDMASALAACWFLENPVSVISSKWRPPDWTFHPHEYGGYLSPPGDAYTKKTCLWTGPGFVMPMKRPVSPTEGSKMHRLPPSKERANLRSATPMGFAQGVFEANEAHLLLRLAAAS